MAQRKTVSRAEFDLMTREATIYQELAWALLRGEKPRRIVSGEWAVWVIATERAHGGLACVTERKTRKRDLCAWTYLDTIAPEGTTECSIHIREAARMARKGRAA